MLDQDLNSKDVVGFVKVPKEELMTEQETERYLELVYGAKEKPAGKLRIKTNCTINNRAENLVNHVLHKATNDILAQKALNESTQGVPSSDPTQQLR